MNYNIHNIDRDALKHSSAQAFYLFSCICIGILLCNENILITRPEIGLICFITLFYAAFNHHIECLRKHEDLGEHAVGNSIKQIKRFTAIRTYLFTFWCISIITIFININWSNYILVQIGLISALTINLVLVIIYLAVWYNAIFESKEKEYNNKQDTTKQKSDNEQQTKCDKHININIKQ